MGIAYNDSNNDGLRGNYMQFDKQALDALMMQNDRALWENIRKIAGASGITLPQNPPPPAELSRLRAMIGSGNIPDVSAAMKTVNEYKKSQGK